MNTAICISGIGKSIHHTFENLKTNLIDTFEKPDVFVYIAKNNMSGLAVNLFGKLDKETTQINLVEEVDLDVSRLKFKPGWLEGHRHKDGSCPTPQGTRRMYNARAVLSDMATAAAIKKDKKYDMVINSRDDVIYHQPVGPAVLPLDMSKLWIPHFHHWLGGYCDRFAVSNKEYMDKYLCLERHFDKYCEEGHAIHSETTHKFHLDRVIGQENIKTFFLEISRVRPDGEIINEGFPNPPAQRRQ
jgi:hypothetical protein|tara:strand:- start:1977 stop:2708 length:732 start_codon:yes stop_codon:yes gene_type:complete